MEQMTAEACVWEREHDDGSDRAIFDPDRSIFV